jgi:hemolysin activation/secretion protein
MSVVHANFRRIEMTIRMRSTLLVLISFLFLAPAGFPQADAEARKAELEKASGQLRDTVQDETKFTFSEDTSPRFLVKELRISGNTLLSTTQLLEKVPPAYAVPVKKDGATVEEVYDFRALRDIIRNPGPKREVSLKTIQGLTKYLLSVYEEKGYAGIYVYVPAKAVEAKAKLEDDILPVEILEGRVAEIEIERYDFDRQKQEKGFLKDSVIESWSPVRVGEVIQKKKLADFVRLLNLNPDRYVSAVVSRGVEPNALNLGYDVYEATPWHWYVQTDNAGTKDRQWAPRVGVINTNLTGMDDRFSAMYQAPWEKGIEDEYAVFGSYDLPVFTPRLRLRLYAGYSKFDIPGSTGINFLGNGSFYGSGLSYNVLQIDNWFFDVTGSVSQENSKVTPSLGLTSDVDMDLWGVGVNIHRSHDLSETAVMFTRTASMGGSSGEEFTQARLNADPHFTIYNVAAAHSQYLDADKVKRLSGSFRLVDPDERLVPAKMTTFGGLYTVRGYEEDEIVADGGILASGQFEYDLVGQTKRKEKPWLRQLAPLAFIDYGRAKTESPVPGERTIRELSSAGLGMVFKLGDNLSGGIYCGWPLRGTDETDRGDARWNFSFIYRF